MVKNVNAIPNADVLVTADDLVKKVDYNTQFDEIEKKIPDHDKYISTKPEFNKLMENFATRLKEVKIANKDDIADFVKEIDFDENLININKIVTSNNRS